MAPLKRIAKVSNRDRVLVALACFESDTRAESKGRAKSKAHQGSKDMFKPTAFRQKDLVMQAKRHSESAGEQLGMRSAANLQNELTTLLADGVLEFDEATEEYVIPEETSQMLVTDPLDKGSLTRNSYLAAAQHLRKLFPLAKRKTKLEYLWLFIKSRGRLLLLERNFGELRQTYEDLKKRNDELRSQLAKLQTGDTCVAGPSTPARVQGGARSPDAYPTPALTPKGLPVTRDPPLLQAPGRAPLTPPSIPRLGRQSLGIRDDGPPTPSPVSRQNSTCMYVDDPMDEDDDGNDGFTVPRAGQGKQRADAAEESDDKDELSDVDMDMDDLEPLDEPEESDGPSIIKFGGSAFMRIVDFVGDAVGAPVQYLVGRQSRAGSAVPVPAPVSLMNNAYAVSSSPVTRSSAAGATSGAATEGLPAVELSAVVPTNYCSRAVSPFPAQPDPREAEIHALKSEVAELQARLQDARRFCEEKDARVDELHRQLAAKTRRLHVIMGLHALMSDELADERADN